VCVCVCVHTYIKKGGRILNIVSRIVVETCGDKRIHGY